MGRPLATAARGASLSRGERRGRGRPLSFFEHIGGDHPGYGPPSRVYAWIDATSEDVGEGLTRLDCVDASWADEAELRPGLLADQESAEEAERRISMMLVQAHTTEKDEGQILELALREPRGRGEANSQHFLNLTGPPLPRAAKIRRPDRNEAARIARITEIGDEDADDDEIAAVLRRVPDELDAVAVYDVGQGSCSAVIANDFPRLYFDVGGGALADTATFPDNFKGICTGSRPPVVLSHWHYDHWSMAKRFGDDILGSPWIVPRQPSFRPGAATLLGLIRRNGTALVRKPRGTTLRIGAVSLHDCMGTTLNDSGLAMIVWGPDDQPIVLPGDARYKQITGLPREVLSLVAAHHGGRTRSTVAEIPLQNGGAAGRLVYSCGDGNSYGHPLPESLADHEYGWRYVPELRTSDRPQNDPARNVHLYFDSRQEDVGLLCSGEGCALLPSRR